VKRPLDEIQAFRAQELLLARATQGLTDDEAAELVALGADEDVSLDLAAAAVDIATLEIEPMPTGVADKVLVAAGIRPSNMQVPTTLAGVTPAPPARPTPVPGVPVFHPEHPSPPRPTPPGVPILIRRSRAPMIVAWTAAAAGILLGVGALLWASHKQPEKVTVEVPVIKVPATPAPAAARQQLLASAADVRTLAWTATTDPAATAAKGDVVWSASKQEGYMRFVGLAANDPSKTQYQLWIFDKDRDDKYPVDGGVFDVGPNGEVVIKISPKLHVAEPVLFAVTVEQPGGVVVSKRERIVVTAAPAKTG